MNIVITGAGKGIGFELVRCLSKDKNHRILALSRNGECLQNLKKICWEENQNSIEIVAFDITNFSHNLLFQESIKKFQSIDILINNAGLLINKAFLELSPQDWKAMYEVNVFGVAELVKYIHPQLSQSKNAHIVNIGSMGGVERSSKFKGLSAYSSSKAALANLTECLAEELKDDGIHCNCLCLGAVDTEMLRLAFPDYSAEVSTTEMAKLIGDFALNNGKLMNGKIVPVSASTP